jgi:hypothetical protein
MFTDSYDPLFVKTIDDIIINSTNDVKIKIALYILDKQSKQKGATIYQIIYELMQKDIIDERSIS